MFYKSFISGLSLVEVIIALAIFSLIAAAFVSLTLGSISNVGYGTDFLTADTLADQGVGAVRAIRDNAWNNLITGPNKVGTTTNGWVFIGVGSQTFDQKFNRTITLDSTCRDGLGLLAPCPATRPDLETMDLKVEVNGPSPMGMTQEVTRQTYLTNWDSRDWIQTDWSGGPGQPLWSNATRYDSDDGKIDVTAVGMVKLKSLPAIWSPYSPSPVTVAINEVHCIAVNDCWAVGVVNVNEVILRWFGASPSWVRLTASGSIPNTTLNSVYCVATNDCWAVGNASAGETILRWTGGPAWSRQTLSATLPNVNLNSVFTKFPTGWAVGASGNIFRLTSGGYEMNSTLYSSVFDMSDLSPVQLVSWDESVPVCSPLCSIKLNIRTATTLANLAAAPWSADFTTAAGTLINPSYNGTRFMQYQAHLAGDGVNTPILQEVRLNYK